MIQMGSAGALILVGVIVALAVVDWGALKSGRSVTVAIVAFLVAVLTAGCGWYAFAESRSMPWTVDYGVVSLMSLGIGMKNLIGSPSKSDA